jgi:predicted DNA-binding antitoxin AbrB/MazE fold protein
MTIRAIYENGVFRPTEPVNLPDKTPVEVSVSDADRPQRNHSADRVVRTDAAPTQAMARIYEILSRSYDTDDADLAEKHNEHQP